MNKRELIRSFINQFKSVLYMPRHHHRRSHADRPAEAAHAGRQTHLENAALYVRDASVYHL